MRDQVNKVRLLHTEILVLSLILLFVVVLRIPTLFEPWGGDQGVFGHIANGILKGEVPYKDMKISRLSKAMFWTWPL